MLSLFVFGLITSFFVTLSSIGAGVILSFFLLNFTKYNERRIVIYTLIFGVAATLVSTLVHASLQTTNYSLAGLLLIGAIPGSLLGRIFSSKIDSLTLRKTITVLILLSAIFILIRTI